MINRIFSNKFLFIGIHIILGFVVTFLPIAKIFTLLIIVLGSLIIYTTKNRNEEAKKVLVSVYGEVRAEVEVNTILNSLEGTVIKAEEKVKLKDLFKPALRFVLIVGLVVGVLQQITGINAVYF